jgi:DNA replication protein DnaC
MIPARYAQVKKEDIPTGIRDIMPEVLKGKGLYLYGNVGTGKTHILWAIVKHLRDTDVKKRKESMPQRKKEAEEKKENYYFPTDEEIEQRTEIIPVFNTVELLRSIRDDFDKKEHRRENRLQEIMEQPIAVLDDVGSEKMSEWVQETFYLIINNRYEHKKPLIISSNFNIQDLAQRIGDRTVSRIVEMCYVVEIRGKDKRMEKPNKIIV